MAKLDQTFFGFLVVLLLVAMIVASASLGNTQSERVSSLFETSLLGNNNNHFGNTFNFNNQQYNDIESSNKNDELLGLYLNSNSRGKRSLGISALNQLIRQSIKISFHFSYYFGWLSLLGSIIALIFKFLIYRQEFVNVMPQNIQVVYKKM